ncbi:MAG: hypothetical protein K2Q24_00835 [Chitinophagaceae bacterium]|nr:hypothetical protein [Chitinophagaceae bacterium]
MRKCFFLLSLFFILVSAVTAQKQKITTSSSGYGINYNEVFKPLKWRNIGPFRGGRANAISGVKGNDKLFYAGYTGGGVWKTEDGGLAWQNISDGFFKVGSIGDIAVSESDPNVIYVGTGEHAVRGVMTSYGDGIYKSTDAGKTWKNVGLMNTRHISDVVIHPGNPDVVYVGAQGTAHGPNADRGVYKSTDAGATWKKTLFVNDSSGISSLVMDMNNPRVLYAATWQHQRLPWKVVSGGNGCAIYKSTDAGETWVKMVDGLPAEMGKIGLSVSRANPNKVFAIVEAEKSKAGLYRSDDGGKRWALQSNDQNITSRSWYYMEVFADPKNENIVYVLNAPMMKSIDGGRTFSNVRVGHGDTHDLWINPDNPANIGLADDGGAEITYNNCRSWSSIMNQPTAQFYRVNVDNRFPYWVYGGQQDNTSVMIASRTNGFGITEKDWMASAGCESSTLAFDPNNPVLLYGGCYQGYIEVLDTKTMEAKDIQAYPSLNLAIEPKDMKYRFNWNAPILASPHDPKTIYHAGNVVLKTSNGGLTWEAISPDLTRNEKMKQGVGGGPITNEGAGGENYNTINYITESNLEKGVIWTGSDCGFVFVSMNAGNSWSNVTPTGLQESMVHSIELSPHDKATAYVCATRYKFNDYGSYTYKTTDYGKTWTKISAGVDADDFIRVIREDKKVKGLLYAGSERGFYISYNGGEQWNKMQLNLPVVLVTDLMIKDNDLVAATAGRAFWILDDLSPFQQAANIWTNKQLKIFSPKTTVRYSGAASIPGLDPGNAFGSNPVEGVMFDYYLPSKPDTSTVQLTVMNSGGTVVRTYTNKPNPDYKRYPGGPPPPVVLSTEEGMNRFAWDFRGENITPDITGAYTMGDFRGHRLPPGTYKAVLSFKGANSETMFTVTQDPNLSVSAIDWAEQQQFLTRVSKDISTIHTAIIDLRKIKKQVEHYNELLKDKKEQKDLVEAGTALIKKITALESNLIETRQRNFQDVINWPSKLNAEFFNLKTLADSHDPRITNGLKMRLTDLEAEWMKHKTQMDVDLKKAVDEYNQKFKAANISPVIQ